MRTGPHILLVDDDREIRSAVSHFLAEHGFRVSTAADGRAMARTMETAKIDLVILDLMLPGEDGLSLCRHLRSTSSVPIVMLTAMGDDTDRIVGLEMGADDYLPKPCNPRELLARVKAVLRRTRDHSAPKEERALIYLFDGWRFDLGRRELTSPDTVLITLSGGEFTLLQAFVEHPRRVLTRDQLLDLARGRSALPFDRSIDVQVSRLRRKLESDPKEPALIKTVRNGGYFFAAEVMRDDGVPVEAEPLAEEQ
ncbi:MAG: DNA-binding response regulator [Rhodospirillales bacterium]|jgi:two-component system OmpR family response regulator|nr:DNA-binding response regulator [Rhodospirillales bacterium]